MQRHGRWVEAPAWNSGSSGGRRQAAAAAPARKSRRGRAADHLRGGRQQHAVMHPGPPQGQQAERGVHARSLEAMLVQLITRVLHELDEIEMVFWSTYPLFGPIKLRTGP